MKSIYLCGPISGCSYDECTDWRKYVAKNLASDVVGLSPMRGKGFLEKELLVGKTYEDTIMCTDRAITTRDRFDVQNCDAVFANFLGTKIVSIGSVIELGWADAWRKPVIMVMEPDGSNIHEHPIVERILGFRVSTLEEGILVANAMLSVKFAKEHQ